VLTECEKTVSMSLSCPNCKFKSQETADILKHQYSHKNDKNAIFSCGLCASILKSYDSLKSHIRKAHEILNVKEKGQSRTNIPNQHFLCPYDNCSFFASAYETIKQHIYKHFEKVKIIICPTATCKKIFSTKNSFRVHRFRFHRIDNFVDQPQIPLIVSNLDNPSTSQNLPTVEIACNEESGQKPVLTMNGIQNNLLPLILKLKSEFFISEKVLQIVIDEIINFDEVIKTSISSKIEKVCKEHNVVHLQDALNNELGDVGCMTSEEKVKLKTAHRRIKHFKSSSNYISSLQVSLGRNNHHRICKYHYIPITKTIKKFLSDPSVNFSGKAPDSIINKTTSSPHILKDYTDGSFFKEAPNHTDIEIMLYQDAFEVCIVIGSAKKRYKMVGLYMVFGHLDKYHRYLVDNIQLVLLCRSIHVARFGLFKVLEKTVAELKLLESKGVKIHGKTKKVRVIGMIGDNLGSHEIGGFCQNFSTNKFPCRYCYTTMSNIRNRDYNIKEERSIYKHIADVTVLQQNDTQENYKGIKFDSILNQLKNFHICQPGLPPCISHDIFEGILQYDLILLIHHYSDTKADFYDFLNMSLTSLSETLGLGISFPEITKKTKKLPGKAYENWQILVLLPYIFKGLEIDFDAKEWLMFTNLVEICRIVCAHEISIGQVIYLSKVIDSFFLYRKLCFPEISLRPKHHYLAHYPLLIKLLGPLRVWWAMRFEAKHQYFKQCLLSAKCFINPTKTLTERHQLFQSTLYGKRSTQFNEIVRFVDESSKIPPQILINISAPTFYDCFTSTATFMNITYKVGDYVLIFEEDNRIDILKVENILVSTAFQKLLFYGCTTQMWFNYKSCLFESFSTSNLFRSCEFNELLIKKPLKILKIDDKLLLSLPFSFIGYAVPAVQ
jgi:hypothetical protein